MCLNSELTVVVLPVKLPVVLGELLAGIIVSPFAFGAIPLFDAFLSLKSSSGFIDMPYGILSN